MKKRIDFTAKSTSGRTRSDNPIIATRATTLRGVESALRAAGHLHNDETLERADFMMISARSQFSGEKIAR